MRVWIVFLVLPLALLSEEPSLPPAAPMPLMKGDPLEIDPGVQEMLEEFEWRESNQQLVRSRDFPLFSILLVLLLMGSLPWVLRAYLAHAKLHPSAAPPPTLEELLNQLQSLEGTRGNVEELSVLVKKSFEPVLQKPCEALTFAELIDQVKDRQLLSPPAIREASGQLKHLESLCFQLVPQEEIDWPRLTQATRTLIRNNFQGAGILSRIRETSSSDEISSASAS